MLSWIILALGVKAVAAASPTSTTPTSEPTAVATAVVGNLTFVNKGLVAFGLIPSNATDSTGETIGGIGSAIAIKPHTFKKSSSTTYTGTLIVQPDRGYNIITTVDFQARQHEVEFTMVPYYGAANLSFEDALQTFQLDYRSTLLYFYPDNTPTSGLDALGIRAATAFEPKIPVANQTYEHLSSDSEGLVLNWDGTFFSSDEYGPYIYHYDWFGDLIQTIVPPEAFLPLQNGTLNFTASVDPTTGRAANQGFEGLSASPDGKMLYALLQSALMQDGGDGSESERYTRLLAYSFPDWPILLGPKLVAEYVVPLPISGNKGKVYAASELHYLSPTTFLALSRDGKGHGDDTTESKYKQIDLVDVSGATSIAGTQFDSPSSAVAPGGVLVDSVTPAEYVSFVSLIDDTQLGRFSVHNGGANDSMLIDAKWESIALAPVEDPAFPNDFFLFTAADNDFITEDGISVGEPYNAGENVDSQFMVYRVTLPNVPADALSNLLA